jgi:hypothetical protein
MKQYEMFECITDLCDEETVLSNSMCSKCFYNKYPDIYEKVEEAKNGRNKKELI